MHRLAGNSGDWTCAGSGLPKNNRVVSLTSVSDWSRLNGGGVVCWKVSLHSWAVCHLIVILDCLIEACVCSKMSQLLASVALQNNVGYAGRCRR